VSSLLSQEIAGKYGVHRGGWFLVEARTPYGVCFWRNIRNVWENFSNFFSFEVGDGSHICFWYDVWYREAALKTIFLDLYLLAVTKWLWCWIIYVPSAFLSIGIQVLQGQFKLGVGIFRFFPESVMLLKNSFGVGR
jgi:hypothetical protein